MGSSHDGNGIGIVGADKGYGMICVLVFDEKGLEVVPRAVVHLLVLRTDVVSFTACSDNHEGTSVMMERILFFIMV